MIQRNKKIHITASTGIARLNFRNGLTLHHWSGYGDGHKNIDDLIQEIIVSVGNQNRKAEIQECEVLIIDEIGMISAKMFSEVELICRSVRGNSNIFGGIQVIAAGSFLQLPPVPSQLDQGNYAFESNCFSKVFPHKLNFNIVHRQKDMDLINAINELCEGKPTKGTEQLLIGLKRPLAVNTEPLYIFGTNNDVDFFNQMTLSKLNGHEYLFSAEDVGDNVSYRRCGAKKYLTVKLGCKVVITRNLYNGLVNGLSGTVTEIQSDYVKVLINSDTHFKHMFSGRVFSIHRYTFTVRDNFNNVIGIRKQLPLKLGYVVTVDKSQGCTLDAVVVEPMNFWRPGQFGVAVGRATCKDAIQLTSFNKEAAHLNHPSVVTDYYNQRSLLMMRNLVCCNQGHVNNDNFLTKSINVQVATVHTNLEENLSDFIERLQIHNFPFDIENYTKELIAKLP